MRSSGRPVSSATRSGGNCRMRCAELVEADRVVGDVVAVLGAHVEHDVEQAERERGVAAGERREPLVGALGGARADRVDRDHVRAALLRLAHELEDVVAARERVRAPQQDELGVHERLGVHPGGGAGRVARADPACDAARRHLVVGRAEHVPQRLAGAAFQALHVAERARALERPDRLAAELVADLQQAFGDLGGGLVPADALEATLALRADAAQRVQQPVVGSDVIQIAVDLGAQRARGVRVIAVPAQAGGLAVLDRDDPAAPVGAVERARTEDVSHGYSAYPCRVDLPPHARVVLGGPDFIARNVAGSQSDPQQRWILRRPRDVRRDFLREVVDGKGDQERWMLLQHDDVCRSYVEEVLEREPSPDRQAIWLLRQPRGVRRSYVEDVLTAPERCASGRRSAPWSPRPRSCG